MQSQYYQLVVVVLVNLLYMNHLDHSALLGYKLKMATCDSNYVSDS